jgi:hypothetical protein
MGHAGSIDLTALSVAFLLLLATFWVAARTRSPGMRLTLLAVASLIGVLMLWNLVTRGGFNAI